MSTDDLIKASEEIDEAAVGYLQAAKYYDGDDQAKFLSDVYRDFLSGEDFEGTLNYAKIPVDAVADRLQLLSITGPTDEISDKIAEIMDANKMRLRFGQFLLDTLKYGDNYMSVWPEEDASSEPEDIDEPVQEVDQEEVPLNHKAKMLFADPVTTRAFYDDGGELMFVARKWLQKDANGKEICRVNLNYKDRIEKYWWLAKEKAGAKKAQEWFDEGQTEWPLENPFGEIPFFHYSTSFPYGEPEHKQLYDVQDAMNKIFQIHIGAIEALGFPTVYALMDETSAAGTSDFEYDPIDSTSDSGIDDVNQLKNKPGEVWALRAKSVGQLKPAGSSDFLSSLKEYKEISSELTSLPARLFTSTDGQHPGADAQNAADAVLNQRVIDRAEVLSETLKHMICFTLRMAFGIEVDAKQISIVWKPQKKEVDSNSITLLEFKMDRLFFTPRRIMTEMGYTQAECDEVLGIGEDGTKQIEEARVKAIESMQAAAGPGANNGKNNDNNNEQVKTNRSNSDTKKADPK